MYICHCLSNQSKSITLPHSFPNSTNVIPHSPFPIQYLMKFVSIFKLNFEIESRTILLQPIMLLMRWPYVLKRFFCFHDWFPYIMYSIKTY